MRKFKNTLLLTYFLAPIFRSPFGPGLVLYTCRASLTQYIWYTQLSINLDYFLIASSLPHRICGAVFGLVSLFMAMAR